MFRKESGGINKITLGMILLALGGLFLGASIGYYMTSMYLNSQVLKEMKAEGYVMTNTATATADDIVKGKSAYVNGVLVNGTLEVLDTSDATAMAEYIRNGKTAYVNGELVIGTLQEISGQTVKPKSDAVRVPGNGILTGDIIISGDKNLKSGNIRKGYSLWGVAGTYVKEKPVEPEPEEPETGGTGE